MREILPSYTDPDFFTYLADLTTQTVSVYAIPEGSVVFPKVPLMRIEGPLPVVQLLETTLLNLVNYARYVRVRIVYYIYSYMSDCVRLHLKKWKEDMEDYKY